MSPERMTAWPTIARTSCGYVRRRFDAHAKPVKTVYLLWVILESVVMAVLFVVIALVLAGYWAHLVMARRAAQVEGQLWEVFAREHGLSLRTTGPTLAKQSHAEMEGTWAHCHCRVETLRRDGKVATRVTITPDVVRLLEIRASTPSRTERVSLQVSPPASETLVRQAKVGEQLDAFAGGGEAHFLYQKGHLSLEWWGVETNPARLEEAIKVVCGIHDGLA